MNEVKWFFLLILEPLLKNLSERAECINELTLNSYVYNKMNRVSKIFAPNFNSSLFLSLCVCFFLLYSSMLVKKTRANIQETENIIMHFQATLTLQYIGKKTYYMLQQTSATSRLLSFPLSLNVQLPSTLPIEWFDSGTFIFTRKRKIHVFFALVFYFRPLLLSPALFRYSTQQHSSYSNCHSLFSFCIIKYMVSNIII